MPTGQDRAPRSGAFVSRFSTFGRPGSRLAPRAFTLAVAVGALAPLAATTTASAAGGSSHSLRGTSYAHHTRAAALKALKDVQGVHALAHQKAAAHHDGFVRSQFPARGPVNAMLQLSASPAVRTYVATRGQGRSAATSAARTQRARIATLTRSVQSHFAARATSAHTLFTVHNVYAGIAVRTDATRLAALSRVSGVVAVRPLPTYHATNASTVPLVGAPDVWNGAGNNTGEGVRIGIIDTGIDYTHANFGGTGSRRAYDADHAVADSSTLNVPTGDYPSQKVAGGVDLAGDAYDPESSDPAVATPRTDPNPLDCDGHGSHVAGTAA